MNERERKSLAEQLLANPLYAQLHDEIERMAIEQLIAAKDEQSRLEAQFRVRAVRTLRTDCERYARNNGPRKAAPA